MNQSPAIIDLEFGLSQLSGNRTLLVTLLQKFAAEYRTTSTTLQQAAAEQQWDNARLLVHTLKGVAGNLGLNALHHESRDYENHIKAHHSLPPNQATFEQVLNQTITEIDALDASAPAPAATPDNSDAARTALIRALEGHEFIPQDQLDGWLADMQMSDVNQQLLQDAIDELDYDAAVALLK